MRINIECQNGSGRTRNVRSFFGAMNEATAQKVCSMQHQSLTQDVLCEQIWVVLFVAQAKLFQTGVHRWLEFAFTVLVNRAKSIPNAFG